MDYKNWFYDLETKEQMNSCAIGIIGEIMGEEHNIAYRKLFKIARTLEALEEAWNAKNPLLLTEGTEEICHPDCMINVTKAQSLLEPWPLEQISRRERRHETRISNEHLREVCRIGQGNDCCRYLICGKNGFQCSKHSNLKSHLDAMVTSTKMTAQGDNCDGKL